MSRNKGNLSPLRRWGRGLKALAGSADHCLLVNYETASASVLFTEQQAGAEGKAMDNTPFFQTARTAREKGKGVVSSQADDGKQKTYLLAYPYKHFVIVLRVAVTGENQLQRVMRRLEAAVPWLDEFLALPAEDNKENEVLSRLVQLFEAPDFKKGAEQFAEAAMLLFRLDHFAIAICDKGPVTLVADSITTGRRAGAYHTALKQVHEECLDQGKIVYYTKDRTCEEITARHKDFAAAYGCASVLTIPFTESGGTISGCFLFACEKRIFSSVQISRFESCGTLAGKLFLQRYKREQPLYRYIGSRCKQKFSILQKGGRAVRGTVAAFAVISMLFLLFYRVDFYIPAEIELVGEVQQVVSAPFSGYIRISGARAGEKVKKGVLLAGLDTDDITLEQMQWASRKKENELEYRKSVADGAASVARMIRERIKQAELQLALLESQKERAEVLAPFDGVIIKGDLSRSIGAPVEWGQPLFELVPQGAFRVFALVDEVDIIFVQQAQQGSFVLSSMPEREFGFTVDDINPVSLAEDGKNRFKVEGKLVNAKIDNFQPGMRGYGKIAVAKKPLFWIWTRKLRGLWQTWSWRIFSW